MRRPLLWLLLAVPAAAVIYLGIIAVNWPFTERQLTDALQERSLRTVTIGRFTQTYFPPGCVAQDVRFLQSRDGRMPPLARIEKLAIEDNYFFILTLQHRLPRVVLHGLHVVVPPHDASGERSGAMPLTHSSNHKDLPIESLTADNVQVDFAAADPKEEASRLLIPRLRLTNLRSGEPMNYWVELSTSALPGTIKANGRWGPWDPGNPGNTPVQGTYTFQQADLSRFDEFAGTLNSSGRFEGKISAIAASGTVGVKDFHLKNTGHTRDLSASYRAVIDGRSGDVQLPFVLANFDRTAILAKGSIAGSGGEPGKTLDFDLYSDRARAEDLIRLFISSPHSPFTGRITFQAHAVVPPGPEKFVRRLRLDGGFGVTRSEFKNPNLDRELARLSVSAVKGDKEEDREDPQSVLTNLGGLAVSRGGLAHLKNVSFEMPGAKAMLAGTYSLDDYRTDLAGTLLTAGNLSDTTTGVKCLLVKILTPFLKKNAKVKSVPFRISGPYHHVSIALNLGKKGKA